MHFLVSELYIYQNARCNNKKIVSVLISCCYRKALSVAKERIHVIIFFWPVKVFISRRSLEYEGGGESSVENITDICTQVPL